MAKKVLFSVLFVVLVILIGAASGSRAQDEASLAPSASTSDEAVLINRDITDADAVQAVTAKKAVETVREESDNELRITYVVTFTNDMTAATTLDWITDTLPVGFEYWGMAAGSDVLTEPVDTDPPEIIWQGPFTVPAEGDLYLAYLVEALATPGIHTNTVEAIGNGVPITPAQAAVTVEGTIFSLGKKVTPQTVTVGQLVTYDVTISNEGNFDSGIAVITDDLPSRFEFVRMDPASDVSTAPTGTSDTIVWTGPFTVPKGGELHLIYQVRTSGVGNRTNSVECRDTSGNLLGPKETTVTVTMASVYLPHTVYNSEIVWPTFLDENFVTGVSQDWVPFVNWPELSANQWYYKGDYATWGRLEFSPGKDPLSQWALNMYLAPGAEEWTDYVVEASVRADKRWEHPLTCLWFRGTHEERTDKQGGDVTGYVLCLRPDEDYIFLGYVDPAQRTLSFRGTQWCKAARFNNYTNEWYNLVVEVRGSQITAKVRNGPTLDWIDTAGWLKGSVGFAVYRGYAAFDWIKVEPLQ